MTVPSGERHPWELGASEEGVVVGEYLAGAFRVVGLGPAAGHRSLDPHFAKIARGLLDKELRGAVPLDEPADELIRLVRKMDRGVRTGLPEGNDARATMVSAMVTDGKLWCAHTGEGSAYRLRGDELTCLVRALPDSLAARAQRSRMSRSASRGLLGRHHRLNPGDVPWIGPRTDGDERQPVMVRTSSEPIELQEGDRILLCTTPPSELEHIDGLATLIGEGLPDLAAQAICDVLAMRDGLGDVAVALLEWGTGPVRIQRRISIDSLGDDLFANFEDLVKEITDELDIEPPTPAPAPTRGSYDPDARTENSELYTPYDYASYESEDGEAEPGMAYPEENWEAPETEDADPEVPDPDPGEAGAEEADAEDDVAPTEPHGVNPDIEDVEDVPQTAQAPGVDEPASSSSARMGPALPLLVVGGGVLALLGLIVGTAIAFALL